jgi:hypothetical protein
MKIIQLDVVFVIFCFVNIYLASACLDPLGLEQTNTTVFNYEASLVENGNYFTKL